MKLYSGPLSLFTAKVRIALDEKGLAVERIEVPFSRESAYEPKHPEVLRINPKAQVPVFVDGDLELYDSTLILEYLEEIAPTPPLLPGDPRDRARVRQLELSADEVFFPHVWTLIAQRFYATDSDTADPEAVDAALAALAGQSRELDRRLGDADYLGGAYSIADIAYGMTFRFATQLGFALPDDAPALAAWLERVHGRPAFQREIEGENAFVATLLSAA
ncbi:MAG: glutathione S-transferase family protein [Myxococcota bacterium]|nr:glutathione S-transferase family protein [Myxococcota bacterium]